jgi:histidinol phosphatase-like enzyme
MIYKNFGECFFNVDGTINKNAGRLQEDAVQECAWKSGNINVLITLLHEVL